MKKQPTPAAEADTAPAPRRGRHMFVVNAGRDMLETEIDADDFEVDGTGVHFWIDVGDDKAETIAFVSHPCMVQKDDDNGRADKREPA